jgi:arylsulfatase A-like enzyme
MNWRRSFNLGGKGGLAVSLAVALMAGGSSGAAAERPPNFLFIYTDDQRYDAVGVVQREQGDRGRFPWLQTPHMDRLAAEGMRFRNAFVTLPLCAPSRAAFLTGRYNHLNVWPTIGPRSLRTA